MMIPDAMVTHRATRTAMQLWDVLNDVHLLDLRLICNFRFQKTLCVARQEAMPSVLRLLVPIPDRHE